MIFFGVDLVIIEFVEYNNVKRFNFNFIDVILLLCFYLYCEDYCILVRW